MNDYGIMGFTPWQWPEGSPDVPPWLEEAIDHEAAPLVGSAGPRQPTTPEGRRLLALVERAAWRAWYGPGPWDRPDPNPLPIMRLGLPAPILPGAGARLLAALRRPRCWYAERGPLAVWVGWRDSLPAHQDDAW